MENKTRREKRIDAVKVLYNMDILKKNIQHINQNFFETHKDAFVASLVIGVHKNLSDIDGIIIENLENYKIERLSYVDRAIIRLATYELMQNTPAQVVIDEALEITKIYTDQGDNKAVAFNNKLLDRIKTAIKAK